MDKTKMCPLAKDKCLCELCAWYILNLDECAVKTLAISISNLSFTVEEIEKENI